MNSDTLKVFMMGGQRVGKTSMLAGLVDTIINGEMRDLLYAREITVLEDGAESLVDKINQLKQSLSMTDGRLFLVDDSKTNKFQNHIIEFNIPGTEGKMSIEFYDMNGEFFEQGRNHDSEIREKMSSYDVFVVAIDTPMLMESANPGNKLCTEAINRAANHVDDIQSFLTNIDDKEGADAKLVLFVPLKCEKWAKENRLNEVSDRVKTVHDTCLTSLSAYKNVEVCIFPIQTVGNVVFVEHQKALLCSHDDQQPVSCCLLDNKTKVRFQDGSVRLIDPTSDKFKQDPEAAIKEGLSLMRPFAWYKAVGETYAPQNCDQLAYYILQFMLAKVNFAKELKEQGRFWNRSSLGLIVGAALLILSMDSRILRYSYEFFMKRFGSMDYDLVKDLIQKMKDRNIIQRQGDGIVLIKKSLLEL